MDTHADAQRFARRNRSRRWLRMRPAVVLVLLLLLAGFLAWAIWFSSLLDARELRVQGRQSLSRAAVVEAARVPVGTPLARLDTAAIAESVRTLQAVKDVDVRRSWPHTVQIRVTERTGVAVLDRGGDYDLVDDEGVVFRPVARRPAGMPVLDVPGPRVRRAAAAAVAALPKDVVRRTDEVRARSADSITLEWADGVTVVWGSSAESDRKGKVLAALLKQKGADDVETFDVSVPGQPTTKK